MDAVFGETSSRSSDESTPDDEMMGEIVVPGSSSRVVASEPIAQADADGEALRDKCRVGNIPVVSNRNPYSHTRRILCDRDV